MQTSRASGTSPKGGWAKVYNGNLQRFIEVFIDDGRVGLRVELTRHYAQRRDAHEYARIFLICKVRHRQGEVSSASQLLKSAFTLKFRFLSIESTSLRMSLAVTLAV